MTAEGNKVTPLLQGGAHVNPVDIGGILGTLRWTGVKGLYTVAARDNLWKIAEKKLGDGTRYTEIRQMNGLTCNIIRVGMPLILPEK